MWVKCTALLYLQLCPKATDLQHLASSRPSEQSFTPSHTLLRGIQCPSPQRNWRGQAGDRQEGDLHVTPSRPVIFYQIAVVEWKHQLLLTALWREGSVEQVEALVSQRFIRMEVEGERRGVDSLFAAV